jgi:predicted transcriptional regulator
MAQTRKRDRLQVIHDILKAIQEKDGKIRPTHILYKSNLSHQMMDEYLKDLIEKGFVKESKTKEGKTYSLEQKGFEFLAKYKTITEFLDAFGLT